MIRLRMLLLWISDRLKCMAHRVDRLVDWTCGESDLKGFARELNRALADRIGFAMSEDEVDLIVRFGEARHRLEDRHPAYAGDYLIAKLQGGLTLDMRRRIVEDLERETGIAGNRPIVPVTVVSAAPGRRDLPLTDAEWAAFDTP